jgi:hypothetical protein
MGASFAVEITVMMKRGVVPLRVDAACLIHSNDFDDRSDGSDPIRCGNGSSLRGRGANHNPAR